MYRICSLKIYSCSKWVILIFVLCLFSPPVYAVTPAEVMVVANSRMAGSTDIAEYYAEKRQVPQHNVLRMRLTLAEEMDREDFNDFKGNISAAIENLEEESSVKIKTIVLVYGVPLRVLPSQPSWVELEHARILRKKIKEINESGDRSTKDNRNEIKGLKLKLDEMLHLSEIASVDSELSLVHFPAYELKQWITNPLFKNNRNKKKADASQESVITVARLDGIDPQAVYKMINDTLFAEKNGLQGTACFDARSVQTELENYGSAYGFYDNSIHKAAELLEDIMHVVVDSRESLFGPGACSNAALYCGWYSLGKYVDSFEWVRGAIGYHIASSECASLRRSNNSQWCAAMLHHGAAAVIGPVAEPYVQGFPLPELFFRELVVNGNSLGESYMKALPYLSWRMVLVGDPLYTPFKQGEEE